MKKKKREIKETQGERVAGVVFLVKEQGLETRKLRKILAKEEDRKVLRDEGVAVVVRGVDASEGTMAEKKKIDRRRGESFWRDR